MFIYKNKENKKMKKIIRITALLIIMSICFLSLISCECKHKNQTPTVYTATCTSRGYTLWICDDCDLQVRRENEVDMLPHTYDMTKCGTTQKCLYCDYTVAIEHEFEKSQDGTYATTCKNCEKMPFSSLQIPELPIELNEETSSGKITDSYEITKIKPQVVKYMGAYTYRLAITIMRIYPSNLSGKANIAWKLYRNGTEVVRSGQEYSTTSIAKGESSTIIIEDIGSYAWEDGYTLKFLHLMDN